MQQYCSLYLTPLRIVPFYPALERLHFRASLFDLERHDGAVCADPLDQISYREQISN